MTKSKTTNNISSYYNSIAKIPLLKIEEEKQLMWKASNGDKAAQKKLVESNIKFVVKIANLYKGKGLDLEDLISEGTIGLMVAAEKVNPEKEVRFITYASWWVRHYIHKALYDCGKAVRIPINRKDVYNSEKWDTISLSDPYFYNNSDDLIIGDIIPDEENLNPEEELLIKSQKELLNDCINKLTPFEKTIIESRFGLNNQERLTLNEVGQLLNTSREAIRLREIQIIKKLRDYIENPDYSIAA